MKHLPLAILAAAVVSGGLYGILSAVDHPAVEPEDPWLRAWKEAGLKGQLLGESTEPDKHLMLGTEGRELMKGLDFQDTVLRRYLIQAANLQVVVLPRASLAPELPEGRHFAFRLKPKEGAVHLCRSGRNLLLVKPLMIGIGFGELPTPKPFLEKLFDVFEKTAETYP
ncbi:MAG TPA: hypothetical protein VEN81_13375 [Planctomycetota bacterium]|nr:hypothetical protein [Planctomycetota bacterium]